jgi:hypothetical protein
MDDQRMLQLARRRLGGLVVLVLGLHVSTLGMAMSAVCVGGDSHDAHECTMPAELMATCPMHAQSRAAAASTSETVRPDHVIRCNCSTTVGIDGLVGGSVAVIADSSRFSVAFAISALPGDIGPASISTPSSIPSPPPRV